MESAKCKNALFRKYLSPLLFIVFYFVTVVVCMEVNPAAAFQDRATDVFRTGAKFQRVADRMKPEEELAKGRFLIAARRLQDPNFRETVVLLIRYGKTGAMGVVINRPIQVRLSEVLPDIKELEGSQKTLNIGGPVETAKMLLIMQAAKTPPESLLIFGDVYLSASRDELRRLLKSTDTKEKFRVYVGYAGWAPHQLESECARGDWHVINADADTVFNKKPSEIWPELIHHFTVKWVHLKTPDASKDQSQSNPLAKGP